MFAMTNLGKYKLQLFVQFTGIIIGLVWIFVSALIISKEDSSLKAMALLTLLMGLVLTFLFSRNFVNFRKTVKGRINAFKNGIEVEAEIVSIKPKFIGRPPFFEWTVKIDHLGKSYNICDEYLSAPIKLDHKAGAKTKVKIILEDPKYFYLID